MAASQAWHDRSHLLFDEALGELLRKNPEAERRINKLSAEIIEIVAAGLRERAGEG